MAETAGGADRTLNTRRAGIDAMILAAGLGARLRPLTDATPKPLIEVGGRPMIDHVAERLTGAGADRLIVNVHHLAEQVEAHLRDADTAAEIRISREEPRVLDTGGGLLHARGHFRAEKPFFLHNGDILSEIPLRDMYEAHAEHEPLATLAVMERETSRKLLFDDDGLVGHLDRSLGARRMQRPPRGGISELGFAGVHVISPRIFDLMTERGAFSILDPYLRLCAAGERIHAYRVDGIEWSDIGTPESLEFARARAAS